MMPRHNCCNVTSLHTACTQFSSQHPPRDFVRFYDRDRIFHRLKLVSSLRNQRRRKEPLATAHRQLENTACFWRACHYQYHRESWGLAKSITLYASRNAVCPSYSMIMIQNREEDILALDWKREGLHSWDRNWVFLCRSVRWDEYDILIDWNDTLCVQTSVGRVRKVCSPGVGVALIGSR